MQAQTQPNMVQAYNSDFACVLKLVFDRVSEQLAAAATRPASYQRAAPACQAVSCRLALNCIMQPQ